MPEDLEPEQQHPAEQRIAEREAKHAEQEMSASKQLAVVDAGLTLDSEKRQALLSVVGDDLSPENLRAKAQAFGWYTPPQETPSGPSADALASDAAALQRTAQAVADAPPPPAPMAPIQSVYERAMNVSNPAELQKLYQEALAAVPASGLQFGTIDHTGEFESGVI